jgi:hypothetical protein
MKLLKQGGPNSCEFGPRLYGRDVTSLRYFLFGPCARAISFTETFPASAIAPFDETRSKVIATGQFDPLRDASVFPKRSCIPGFPEPGFLWSAFSLTERAVLL